MCSVIFHKCFNQFFTEKKSYIWSDNGGENGGGLKELFSGKTRNALTLAGKGLTMINAAGWRPQLNISSWLGKDLQLMDAGWRPKKILILLAGCEERIFFFPG